MIGAGAGDKAQFLSMVSKCCISELHSFPFGVWPLCVRERGGGVVSRCVVLPGLSLTL